MRGYLQHGVVRDDLCQTELLCMASAYCRENQSGDCEDRPEKRHGEGEKGE